MIYGISGLIEILSDVMILLEADPLRSRFIGTNVPVGRGPPCSILLYAKDYGPGRSVGKRAFVAFEPY